MGRKLKLVKLRYLCFNLKICTFMYEDKHICTCACMSSKLIYIFDSFLLLFQLHNESGFSNSSVQPCKGHFLKN